MPIGQGLLNEFENESALTRRCLERIPEDKFDYKPHEKNLTMVALASHIVDMPEWGTQTLDTPEMDIDPETYKPWIAESTADLLAKWDEHADGLKKRLARSTDEEMMVPWALKMGGQEVFRLPRVAVLRSMIFNHMIHHRAQLTLYFRLLDLSVPAIYGPSADEQPVK